MQTIKSVISLSLLIGLIYAVGRGFAIAGWKGAGITLLCLVFFGAFCKAIADTLLATFNRRGD